MPTLADLVRELRDLDVSLSEIEIPPPWYRKLIRDAEKLLEEEDNYD